MFKYGFELETHTVTTSDGYILELVRIPPKFENTYNGYGSERGKPVLIMHGFGDSAEAYFANGQQSIPFILSKAGYDIWLGSSRGSA